MIARLWGGALVGLVVLAAGFWPALARRPLHYAVHTLSADAESLALLAGEILQGRAKNFCRLLREHTRKALYLLGDLVRRCEQSVQGDGCREGGKDCEQRVQPEPRCNQRGIVLIRLLFHAQQDIAPSA